MLTFSLKVFIWENTPAEAGQSIVVVKHNFSKGVPSHFHVYSGINDMYLCETETALLPSMFLSSVSILPSKGCCWISRKG